MVKLFWFEHNCKNGQYSSAKVHNSVKVRKLTDEPSSINDYEFYYDNELAGIKPEILE